MDNIKKVNINLPLPIVIPIDPASRYVIVLNGKVDSDEFVARDTIRALGHHLEEWWLNGDAKWLIIHIPGVEVKFERVEVGDV